jgi:nodulation protein E
MSPVPRVAITGLGAVSALGIGVPAFWDGLVSGRSGVRRLQDPAFIAAQAADFSASLLEPSDRLDLLDRFAQFGLVAAREALAAAGLAATSFPADRAGVSIGSAFAGAQTYEEQYLRLYKGQRVHPFTIPRLMHNAAASQISMTIGFRGPTLSYSTACAAGSHALGEAAEMIRAGRAQIMLAGGTDAPIVSGVMKAWESMRVLAPAPAEGAAAACRPFSRDRQGLVVGEGAGMLVLENWEHALARGAEILAELAGYGISADAGHITQSGLDAPAHAMRLAMAQAALEPSQIDYINAHGTATRLNDSTETTVIKNVLGAHAYHVPISSTKSMHGHAMGASGALEAIACVLALRHQIIPPTANYREQDPECDLDYVPNASRPATLEAVLSNSFGFGGLNAVLAVKRATDY